MLTRVLATCYQILTRRRKAAPGDHRPPLSRQEAVWGIRLDDEPAELRPRETDRRPAWISRGDLQQWRGNHRTPRWRDAP